MESVSLDNQLIHFLYTDSLPFSSKFGQSADPLSTDLQQFSMKSRNWFREK